MQGLRDLMEGYERVGLPPRMVFSVLLWIGFFVYWRVAAANAAPMQKVESPGSRRVHEVLIGSAQLLLLLSIPGLRLRFVPLTPVLIGVGVAVQLGSLALAIWARRHLGRYWSAEVATKVDHQLVRSGPYRVIRHPIYTAVLGLCVGTAIVSGEVHALLGTALMAVAYWRKIRMEERTMLDAFGDTYEEYRRTSKALVPGVL